MEKDDILLKLQEIEFMLIELQLYLDVHPNDKEVLQLFKELSFELATLKCEFDNRHGPLLEFGFSRPKNKWSWINSPWPWQIENKEK